jgi:hypothetical protein
VKINRGLKMMELEAKNLTPVKLYKIEALSSFI